jgi:hypothetical protein
MLLFKRSCFANDDDDYGIFPKDLGEQRKPLISIVNVTAKIRTGYLPNVSLKRHRLSEHARLFHEMRHDKLTVDEECKNLQQEPLVVKFQLFSCSPAGIRN